MFQKKKKISKDVLYAAYIGFAIGDALGVPADMDFLQRKWQKIWYPRWTMVHFLQLENHSDLETEFENRLSDLRLFFCLQKQEDEAHSKMETVPSCESCRWHFIYTIVEVPRNEKNYI